MSSNKATNKTKLEMGTLPHCGIVMKLRWFNTCLLQNTNFLKNGVPLATRFNSNVSDKGKKVVGYWLMTCSGMVFAAVVLGITATYYLILVSIYTVLEEYIRKSAP